MSSFSNFKAWESMTTQFFLTFCSPLKFLLFYGSMGWLIENKMFQTGEVRELYRNTRWNCRTSKVIFWQTLLRWKHLQGFKLPLQSAWNNHSFISNDIRTCALKNKRQFQLCNHSWISKFWCSKVPLAPNLHQNKMHNFLPIYLFHSITMWGLGTDWLFCPV